MPVRKTVQKGKEMWECEVPAYEGTKRRRTYFNTEREANAAWDAFQKDVHKAGEFWARLTPGQRLSVQAVLGEIFAKELTLSGVWEDFRHACDWCCV